MAEAGLRHKAVLGIMAKGRAGFGSFPSPKYSKAQGKERRWLVQDEVRAAVRTSNSGARLTHRPVLSSLGEELLNTS